MTFDELMEAMKDMPVIEIPDDAPIIGAQLGMVLVDDCLGGIEAKKNELKKIRALSEKLPELHQQIMQTARAYDGEISCGFYDDSESGRRSIQYTVRNDEMYRNFYHEGVQKLYALVKGNDLYIKLRFLKKQRSDDPTKKGK